MPRSDLKDVEYLGDGVYVGHDGYHVWLYLDQDLERTAHEGIALEPNVLDRLELYITRLRGDDD